MNGLPLGTNHLGDPPKLSRRQLFVRGALATGGLMMAGIVGRFAWLLDASPKSGLTVFSEKEVDILSAILLALFPGGAGMPAADVDEIVPKLDHFLAHNDPDTRILFKSMLHVIEDHSLAFRLCRFTHCSPDVQAEEMAAWELTPTYLKRSAFRSLKLLAGVFYFEQESAREAMGWYLGCSPSHLVPPGRGGAGV